ncbi:TetR/AcrR family transcriptional regulator [Antrihabitans cavernicola]|uniref:TetR/AcrR family transcriptional regulator n=1 Tax=Antrihabitans cavernicola TaxID=2495913 RepID=A0A5A7SF17_9NOCA|nr:TetR/AcrR family transcriptional regulator [Spelaeibacter cavernicola]KAA0024720.1 TetR/AcrR family transcriptional regulator [Spelaeibacter cavernicola]
MTQEMAGGEVEIPDFLRQLWTGVDVARPGPKRGVDLATIAAAGVAIADAKGLAAVSMRNVAAELGLTSMALYRYVKSKEELVTLIVDEAFGIPDYADEPDASWRELLNAWAQANRGKLVQHPWVMEVAVNEPPLLPHQIAWMERGLAAFADTGLEQQEKLSSMLLVDVYVRGQTQLSVGFGGDTDAGELYGRRLMQLIDHERFPRITDALMSGALEDDNSDFAVDEFRFGLDTVFDGIAARIAARAS